MKRYIALLLSVLMLLMLASCGGHQCDLPENKDAEEEVVLTPEELAEQERLAQKAADEAALTALLSNLTLEEKVGQLFFLRCPASDAIETISAYHLGGILLFGRDYKDANEAYLSRDAFIAKLERYQDAAGNDTGIPLFIGSDEEGGTVTRASRNPNLFSAKYPSPQQLYKAGGMKGLLTDTLQYNDQLRALGINVNFAPVCDISTDSGDFIYERSFGQDVQMTSDYISQVVGVMNTAGIGATLKHFPGYGSNSDTHTGIAVDERPYEQFLSEDYLPFMAGIHAGAPFVLVSHNIVTCLDDTYPASLSPAWHDQLRTQLGFEGVILTDDLDMGAVKAYADNGTIAVLALQAGNDMIVCSDLTQIAAVISAVQNGILSEETVNNACRRVLAAKQSLLLI
ncbi:MAG: glycoside hydrolase family 3 N-terminal domain-containing protein [Eubacteriales bacterium]|nr:glycoside hydrolase family 3 N-terminal domain-containing protein [Eubacteriales bacterium]